MSTEYFTVDAKLLRELGERLVGRPHIALAELIKNAYDADARHVEIVFGDSYIEIVDDGHGMSHQAFVNRWMRIGTAHKASQRYSPELRRRLTGSKGVGRLSAQLLARQLEITSVALRDPRMQGIDSRRTASDDSLHDQVAAAVDWDDAVRHDELTRVAVEVETCKPEQTFAANSNVGTRLVLKRLSVDWDADRFRRLAREIWSLQPPFAVDEDAERAFQVVLVSDVKQVEDVFEDQMAAVLDIWAARISADLVEDTGQEVTFDLGRDKDALVDIWSSGESRVLEVRLDMRDNEPKTFRVRVPSSCVNELNYEIRIFDLISRQPRGVRVEEARGYLREFGGVHIYDSGFRLPYYGPDEDWLGIETYHSHRLSRLRLLPDNMQAHDAANDIPTNGRIYGLARISTGAEAAHAEESAIDAQHTLTIQVTRDRLVDNEAFGLLRRLVNVGLDLYALERARRRVSGRGLGAGGAGGGNPLPRPSNGFAEALDLVRHNRGAIPAPDFERIEVALATAIEDTERIEESNKAHSALLGALATAGMSALAYEHESSKQRALIARSVRSLSKTVRDLDGAQAESVNAVIAHLEDWGKRADRLRGLFSPLLDEADRTEVVAYPAHTLIRDVSDNVQILSRGTEIILSPDPEGLRLPPASYAAWAAVFQNLLINAFNATLKTAERVIGIDFGRGGVRSRDAWVTVQDTGIGVEVETAERFFAPFEREGLIDIEAAALGLGGSGLGLTIVRMIAAEAGARIAFEEPGDGYSTCVKVTWRAEK
jgi:signal transduction histidine kinase